MIKDEDVQIQCPICYIIKTKKMFVFEAIKINKKGRLIELPFICKRCYVFKKKISQCKCSFCGSQIYKEGHTVCYKCEVKV